MLQIIAGDHAAFSNLYWPNYCDHFLLQTFPKNLYLSLSLLTQACIKGRCLISYIKK